MHVVGFNGHFIDYLFIESDSTRGSSHFTQEPVVKTFASTQAAAMEVKCHSGNEDKVKVGRQFAAIRPRFTDAEISDFDVAACVLDAASPIRLQGGREPGQAGGFPIQQSSFKERPNIELGRQWREKQD
jgi:hypothetical protein